MLQSQLNVTRHDDITKQVHSSAFAAFFGLDAPASSPVSAAAPPAPLPHIRSRRSSSVHLSRTAALHAAASSTTTSPLYTLPVLVVGNKVDAAVADARHVSIWRAVLHCLAATLCGPCMRPHVLAPSSSTPVARSLPASSPTANSAQSRFSSWSLFGTRSLEHVSLTMHAGPIGHDRQKNNSFADLCLSLHLFPRAVPAHSDAHAISCPERPRTNPQVLYTTHIPHRWCSHRRLVH